jgi:hypothetical protein
VLSPELEESLWEQVETKKLSVTKLETPSALEVRTRIPAGKKKWYFDDSDDDEKEESDISPKKDPVSIASRQELAQAARSIGRSLLSDTWGSSGQHSDSDSDEEGGLTSTTKRRSSTGSSSRRHKLSPKLVPLGDEGDEVDEDDDNAAAARIKTTDEISAMFKKAVEDMFNATTVFFVSFIYILCWSYALCVWSYLHFLIILMLLGAL